MGEYCAKTLFVKGGPDEVKKDVFPCPNDGITISREVKIFESNMGTKWCEKPQHKTSSQRCLSQIESTALC